MIICFDSPINYLYELMCGGVKNITALNHEPSRDLSESV